jgi:hypothetical protein
MYPLETEDHLTGVIWLDDSSTYVGRKSLYRTPEEFLHSVLAHIEKLVEARSEQEAGWWKVPEYGSYISLVESSWMVHRVNSDWHDAPFWENIEEPGRGHVPVWLIDFDRDIKKEIIRRLKGHESPS